MVIFGGLLCISDVKNYVGSCEVCGRAKDIRHKIYCIHQPLDVPSKPWFFISMDFITDLHSSNSYTCIYVSMLLWIVFLKWAISILSIKCLLLLKLLLPSWKKYFDFMDYLMKLFRIEVLNLPLNFGMQFTKSFTLI